MERINSNFPRGKCSQFYKTDYFSPKIPPDAVEAQNSGFKPRKSRQNEIWLLQAVLGAVKTKIAAFPPSEVKFSHLAG